MYPSPPVRRILALVGVEHLFTLQTTPSTGRPRGRDGFESAPASNVVSFLPRTGREVHLTS